MTKRRLVEPRAPLAGDAKAAAKPRAVTRRARPADPSPEVAPRPAARVATRGKGAASSSSPLASRAALEMLAGTGSAVDAVLAGFFAEAGADDSVFFSPVSALVFGGGAGVRAFDGRARQPGFGAARPRGLKEGDAMIDAARASVSRAPATALLLHTMFGRASLANVTRPGVVEAKNGGSASRSDLLKRLGTSGGSALAREEVVRAILATAGAAAGGAVTEADLEGALPGDVALSPSASFGDARVYRVPWGSQVPAGKGTHRKTTTEVIAACDSRGLVALLSFERGEGLLVPELEVRVPLSGIPVRRGITRTSPGTILPAPAPLAVIDRGADLRVAFAAQVPANARVRVITPKDVEPIAVRTPVDVGVREVALAIGAAVIVVALETRGARAISASDVAA